MIFPPVIKNIILIKFSFNANSMSMWLIEKLNKMYITEVSFLESDKFIVLFYLKFSVIKIHID